MNSSVSSLTELSTLVEDDFDDDEFNHSELSPATKEVSSPLPPHKSPSTRGTHHKRVTSWVRNTPGPASAAGMQMGASPKKGGMIATVTGRDKLSIVDRKHSGDLDKNQLTTTTSSSGGSATTTITTTSNTMPPTLSLSTVKPSSVMNSLSTSLLSLSPGSGSKRLRSKTTTAAHGRVSLSPSSANQSTSPTFFTGAPSDDSDYPGSDSKYFTQSKKSNKRKTLISTSQDSLESSRYYSSSPSHSRSTSPNTTQHQRMPSVSSNTSLASASSINSKNSKPQDSPASSSIQSMEPLIGGTQAHHHQHLDTEQINQLHQLYLISKHDIFQLFQFCSLPSQYNTILKRANHLIINIENQERYLNHLEMREYFYHELNVLLHALNEIIQLLYDVVEDRVMRGEKISQTEAEYFDKVDGLYQHLLQDIYEKMNPPLHVQMLNTEVEQSKTAQFRKIKQWQNHSNENKVSTITLQDEELEIFQQRYLYRYNEKLLNAGVALKIKKDKKLLRYIWLTTYQLMISEQIYVLKSCIDLINISKVNYLSPTYFEIVTEKSEKILLYSKDAQKWCKNVQKAIKSLLSLREFTSRENSSGKSHQKRSNSTHSNHGGSSFGSTLDSFASDFSQLSRDSTLSSNDMDRDGDTNSSFSSTPVDQAALDMLDEELDLNQESGSDGVSPRDKETKNGDIKIVSKYPDTKVGSPPVHSPLTPHSPRHQFQHIEIEVHLLKAENLRPPKKNRPDNPYCWLGVGNPEHYKQDRTERQKSHIMRGKNPLWDQKFVLKLKPQNSFLLDIRVYSQIPQCNHFSYGECTVPLKDLFVGENKAKEIRGWYELTFHGGKQGRVYVSVRIRSKEFPSWLFRSRPIRTPAITTYNEFYIYRGVPMIFGGIQRDICAILKLTSNNKRFVLQDASTKRDIYTLERSNAAWNWKKTYIIKDSHGVRIGKCFHKMKTIRKRKLRLFLANSECLFSMEGGCFNQKSFNNEVLIKNSCGVNVASVVFVDNGSDSALEKKCVIVRILESSSRIDGGGRMLMSATAVSSHIDTMLLLLFSVYTFV